MRKEGKGEHELGLSGDAAGVWSVLGGEDGDGWVTSYRLHARWGRAPAAGRESQQPPALKEWTLPEEI